MNRILLPTLVILLLAVTAVQIRSARSETIPAPSATRAAAVASIVAEGRVSAYPGGEITVGSDVTGRIVSIPVEEQQQVRKGDLLALVNADDTRAALAESQSRVGEIDADIRLFEYEVSRARALFQAEVGTRQTWDKAMRDLDAAKARRQSALAEVRRLDAVLAKTRIVSPIDGIVITRHTDRGEMVSEGDAVVTVANLDRVRVESEVDEFDTARVRAGAPVKISAEGYDRYWRGTVEEIPHSVVSRRLNPPDPSKPIDTRVLLVKIALAEATPLKLGQRVEVEFE